MIKGALLILVNDKNRVLLQHKDAGAPTHPNKWCLFGGGIEDGETSQQAIHREFIEELDWKVGDVKHFAQYSGNDVFFFRTNRSADVLRKKLHEGSDLGYFSEAEVLRMDVAEPHLSILKDYFSGQRPLSVQFVCRGNACRSIIAEAYLKSLKIKGIAVSSAGSVASVNKAENTARYTQICDLLRKHGLQEFTKKTHAEQLTQESLDSSTFVVCVNRNVFEDCPQSFNLPKETYYWDIADFGEIGRTGTSEQELAQYGEDIFKEVTNAVDELVTKTQLA